MTSKTAKMTKTPIKGINFMNQSDEQRLFSDVELIKQKQGHTDATLEKMLQEFINHSTATNKNLTNLTLSSQELVFETRSVNNRIENIEAENQRHKIDNITEFKDIGVRVTSLETFRSEHLTLQSVNNSSKKWWSDNWYKFVLLGILSVPVVTLLYGLLKDVKY